MPSKGTTHSEDHCGVQFEGHSTTSLVNVPLALAREIVHRTFPLPSESTVSHNTPALTPGYKAAA